MRMAAPAKTKPKTKDIAYCRTCYDHLAGEVGVKITDALVARGILKRGENEFSIPSKGKKWFAEIGIDVEKEQKKKRQFARQCVDWTERKHHLAGAVGAQLFEYYLNAGWVKRKPNSRAVEITELGKKEFEDSLGVRV